MAVVQPRRADGLPGRNADAISRPRLALANVGVWLSLVEHLVRDEGVAGSNPATPTNLFNALPASAPKVAPVADRYSDRLVGSSTSGELWNLAKCENQSVDDQRPE